MNKNIFKIILVGFLICTFSFSTQKDTNAASVSENDSRVTYTLKDTKGKGYKVYMIPSGKEKKGRAGFNKQWPIVWAGADEGDLVYHANYKLYLSKSGSKKLIYTGLQVKNYDYNKSRKMVYAYPSKYKGQPSILMIATTESSNIQSATPYYVINGKLKKAKGIYNTLRPFNGGKNKFTTATYDNMEGKWYLFDLSLNLKSNSFTVLKEKVVKNLDTRSWPKHWQ